MSDGWVAISGSASVLFPQGPPPPAPRPPLPPSTPPHSHPISLTLDGSFFSGQRDLETMRMRWWPRGTTSIIVSSRRRETVTERVAEWKLCLSLIFPVFPWVSHVFSLVFVNLLHLVSSALQVPLESGFPSFTRIPGVSLPPGLPCLFFPLDQSLTVQVYPQWISCMYVFPEYVILPQSYPEIPSLSESLVESWFF